MRNSTKEPKITDRWFKIKITARKPRRGEEPVEYAYVTGENRYFVKFDYQKMLGVGYFVEAKPISYDEIIRELSGVQTH